MESLHIAHFFGITLPEANPVFRKAQIYTTLRVIGFGAVSTFLGGA